MKIGISKRQILLGEGSRDEGNERMGDEEREKREWERSSYHLLFMNEVFC